MKLLANILHFLEKIGWNLSKIFIMRAKKMYDLAERFGEKANYIEIKRTKTIANCDLICLPIMLLCNLRSIYQAITS